jgi:hypothetical protein
VGKKAGNTRKVWRVIVTEVQNFSDYWFQEGRFRFC